MGHGMDMLPRRPPLDPTTDNKGCGCKKIRASKPKVKSGCVTCKIRRVKCDERKPSCLRCEKFGRECDGYVTKSQVSRNIGLAALQPRPAIIPSCVPSLSTPCDDQESQYYQLFFDRTAEDLCGFFPTSFWKTVVLQESYSEPSIRHSVVALGALTKSSLESTVNTASVTSKSVGSLTDHQQYALSQHNKAITNLRQTLSTSRPELRTALVACLLFVCFENFHGDYEAASRQTQSGLALLDQWQAQQCLPSLHGPPSQNSLKGLPTDEVFQMFARLDAQAFAHFGAETATSENPRLFLWQIHGNLGIQIPLYFTDIFEARKCYDSLTQRALNFRKSITPFKNRTLDVLPDWLVTERDSCVILLQQFEETFWPVLNQSIGTNMEDAATVLYLANKASIISLYAALRPGECTYDGFTQYFQEIVTKALPIIEKMRNARSLQHDVFAFELGILPPLHLTALKCRHPKIRRQAIAMLLSCPRREGSWDGALLGKIDAWIMRLEEGAIDDFGCLPETARWRLADVKYNLQERWVWARCVQDSYNADGMWSFTTGMQETRIVW